MAQILGIVVVAVSLTICTIFGIFPNKSPLFKGLIQKTDTLQKSDVVTDSLYKTVITPFNTKNFIQ